MCPYFVCIGKDFINNDINSLIDTINPINTMDTKSFFYKGAFAVSYHKNSPLKGDKYFVNDDWIALFTGDLICDNLSWELIIEILENENYPIFSTFNGYFSIIAFHKQRNELFIVSDYRSQQTVFYYIDKRNIVVSTEQSTFCRLPYNFSFNKDWVYEYLFFNIPIGQTTFFNEVKRVSPASVMKIDLNTFHCNHIKYASMFYKKDCLLKGEQAFRDAYEVFQNSVPKYFNGNEEVACALTGGWDARTNLSFCPNIDSLIAYTYGVPESVDLREAQKIANKLNLKHHKILFNEKFEEQLPLLIVDVVKLSGGMERVARSTLYYVYKNLTENGTSYPITISGLSFDQQFRGHACVPSLISPYFSSILSNSDRKLDVNFWNHCIKNDYEYFEKHIQKTINYLEKTYGDLSKSDSHLSYLLYELCPKYFAGEITIANLFTTIRVPAWDLEIINLAYSIENSTLSFSQFLPEVKRGDMKEMLVQSYLISMNGGKLANMPVRGVSPKLIIKDHRTIYELIRIKNLIIPAISNLIRKESPLENWDKWLNDNLKGYIKQLIFDEKSRINQYLNPDFLKSLEEEPDIYILNKLVTIEIISRLIESKWGSVELLH